MHKRLLRILNDQKVLYKKINLDLKKKKNNNTAHAVISLIKNIEKVKDNKVFHKAFDTVDYNILLLKQKTSLTETN